MNQFTLYQCEKQAQGLLVHKVHVFQQAGATKTQWVSSFKLTGNADIIEAALKLESGKGFTLEEIDYASSIEIWEDHLVALKTLQ